MENLEVLTQMRHQLSQQLGDNEAEYLALMSEWFSGRITRAQIDENLTHLFSSDNAALHNRFMLQIFSHCLSMSNKFEENLHLNQKEEIICSNSLLTGSNCTNSFTGIKERPSPTVDDDIQTDNFDDTHSKLCVDPNMVLGSSRPPENPAKFPKFEISSAEHFLPFGRPNFLLKSNSWRDNVEARIPQMPVLDNDTLKPKYCSETGNLLHFENIIGRVNLGLYQNGLATASEESMHLICRATVDIIRQIIVNLLNLNYDETKPNHLLNVNSAADNISFRSQLQPSQELRNCERQLSAEMNSKYSNVPLGVRNLKMLLRMKPQLLPLNELRTVAIERCFVDT